MSVEGGIGVGGAVEQEEIRIRTAAADHDGGTLTGTPIERIRFAGLRAEAHVCSGDGQHKIQQHASIEGQFLNRLRLDDLADTGIGGA